MLLQIHQRSSLLVAKTNTIEMEKCSFSAYRGFTTVRTSRQSKSSDNRATVTRMLSVARRGFCRRSTYNASCFRRNRFSAASDDDDRNIRRRNMRASIETPKTSHVNPNTRDSFNICVASHGPAIQHMLYSNGVFADHRPRKEGGETARLLRTLLQQAQSRFRLLPS